MIVTTTKPEKTKNENHRIEVIKSLNILDTPPEERYDRITRIAKRVFNVPIALISIVDEERQWFKSCIGINVKETGRDISFCGHAILGDDVFVVNDTLEDYRFKENPMVTSYPNIRFYAGIPLNYLDGSKLGTLCIKDIEPRELTAEDLGILKDLGSIVETEINSIHLATVDELTSILNRRGFIILAENQINTVKRLNIHSSLVFIDLNKFKPINDTYGHDEGDRVLQKFAFNLKNISRESDIVARLGGDEFVLFLTDTTKEDTEQFITRLREECQGYKTCCGNIINIEFSEGIVEINSNNSDQIEKLLQNADVLMYKKKKYRS